MGKVSSVLFLIFCLLLVFVLPSFCDYDLTDVLPCPFYSFTYNSVSDSWSLYDSNVITDFDFSPYIRIGLPVSSRYVSGSLICGLPITIVSGESYRLTFDFDFVLPKDNGNPVVVLPDDPSFWLVDHLSSNYSSISGFKDPFSLIDYYCGLDRRIVGSDDNFFYLHYQIKYFFTVPSDFDTVVNYACAVINYDRSDVDFDVVPTVRISSNNVVNNLPFNRRIISALTTFNSDTLLFVFLAVLSLVVILVIVWVAYHIFRRYVINHFRRG